MIKALMRQRLHGEKCCILRFPAEKCRFGGKKSDRFGTIENIRKRLTEFRKISTIKIGNERDNS